MSSRALARFILTAALAISALDVRAGAAPIAMWDIAGAGGAGATVGYTAGGVTATPLVAVGVTPWTYGESGFVVAAGWAPGLAADPAKYFEWSVTADAGMGLLLESVDLALLRGIQGATHGAQLWDLRVSTDGFASSVLVGTLDISASAADTQTLFHVDLPSLGMQTGTITFRLFGYDYTSPADFSGLGNDSGWLIYGSGVDLAVAGTGVSVVPEPATALLLGAGLLVLGVRGRGGAAAAPQRTAGTTSLR